MKIGYVIMQVGVEKPQFLGYDDRGAMATGYPMLVSVNRARIYDGAFDAQESLESAIELHRHTRYTGMFDQCRVQELHTTDIQLEEF